MKSMRISFAAVVFGFLLAGDAVNAAPREARDIQKTDPLQQSYEQTWYTCQARYAGGRGFLAKDRWAYIEQCFHDATGKYPGQLGLNCYLRRC